MILAAAMRERTPIIVASVVFLALLGISIKLLIPPADDGSPPTCPIDDANQMCAADDGELVGDGTTYTAAATTTTAAATTTTVAATVTASAVTPTAAPRATTVTAAAAAKPAATLTAAPAGETATAPPPPPSEAAKPPAPERTADTGNAADHYLAAFDQMKVGERKVMARVEMAAAEGYQGGDEGVDTIVAQNERALSALVQAASGDSCDFGKATKAEQTRRREQAETLASLAAARCRMLAAEGQPGKALRLGVAVVKLAKDIRTPVQLAALETSQALIETVFPALASVLQDGKLSAAELEPAAAMLRSARQGLATPADAASADIAALRAQVLAFIQNDAYFSGNGKDWLVPLPSRMRAAMLTVAKAERRAFANDVMLAFDRRCMRLLDVLGSGKRSHVRQWTADMAQVMVDSKTPGFGRKPAEVAGYLTARFLPQVEPLWSNDAHDRLKGNVLVAMAAAQLQRKEAGAWPESLANPPADPFDAAGGPLRYKVIGVQAVLWSVGPDGVDDGASSATGAGVAGKDIVFWLR